VELQERRTGQVVIIEVYGHVDTDGGEHGWLLRRVRALLDQGDTRILLNVGRVPNVDSLLLGAVVHGYVSAIRRGGALKLLHVTKRFRELLHVTKLDTVLEVFETEEAATGSFQPPARLMAESPRLSNEEEET